MVNVEHLFDFKTPRYNSELLLLDIVLCTVNNCVVIEDLKLLSMIRIVEKMGNTFVTPTIVHKYVLK